MQVLKFVINRLQRNLCQTKLLTASLQHVTQSLSIVNTDFRVKSELTKVIANIGPSGYPMQDAILKIAQKTYFHKLKIAEFDFNLFNLTSSRPES